MNSSMKRLLIYTGLITAGSIVYFIYAYTQMPTVTERETYLSEIGEGIGQIGMWALIFIYFRTVLKLVIGKGPIAKRLLPVYKPSASVFKSLIVFLDKTHVHVGIAAIVIIALHIALLGAPMSNLFFPAVILLMLWQAVFGMFLRWRGAPRDIKKFSYSVHAQLITGVMMGVFAYFGHLLIDM